MVRDTELYDVLELAPNCSEAEIKKAYRRLSLIHHPDRQSSASASASGSSTPVDHAKFQSLQNAYEILSDPEKRDEYDEYGKDGPRGGMGGMGGMDADDLFASMFGFGPSAGGGRGRGGPSGGGARAAKKKTQTPPSVVRLPVTLEELFMGKEKKLDTERARTCGGCKGTGAKINTKPRSCAHCEGQGMVYGLRHMGPMVQRIPMECPECQGKGSKIRPQDLCKKCRGSRTVKEKNRVVIHIERGMHPGSKIVVASAGDESPDSASPGDLHIHLTLLPHSTFTFSPSTSSLTSALSLTLSESLLGFSRLILVHLDGRGLRVNQPAPGQEGWRVLKSGDEVVVKGEGMWRRGKGGVAGGRGDLILKVEVEWPGEGWAQGMGAAKIAELEKLLPPKRMDVQNPVETDEVELVEKGDGAESHSHHAHESDDDDEDEYDDDNDDGPPGCHQQ